jgi:hypothetical protein
VEKKEADDVFPYQLPALVILEIMDGSMDEI